MHLGQQSAPNAPTQLVLIDLENVDEVQPARIRVPVPGPCAALEWLRPLPFIVVACIEPAAPVEKRCRELVELVRMLVETVMEVELVLGEDSGTVDDVGSACP